MLFAPGGYVYETPGSYAPSVPAALAGQYATTPPAPRPPAVARGAAPRPAVYRGQAPEDAPAARLTPVSIPTPEQLGVSPRPSDGGVDWNAAMRRLRELGADHQLVHLPTGGWQFTCFLQLPRNIIRRIEATAPTEAEAVRLGLERTAQERGQRLR